MQTTTFDIYYDGDLTFVDGDYMLVTDRNAFKNVIKMKTAISAGDFLADKQLGSNLMIAIGNLPPSATDKEIVRVIKGEITKALFYADAMLAALANVDVQVSNTADKSVSVSINFNDANISMPQSISLNFVYTYSGWQMYIDD